MEAKVFFSYSFKDHSFLEELKKHLIPLQREGLINEIWYDRNISAGKEREKEIDEHLSSSHVILLLVSPDFIASEYCYGKEVIKAIERHDQGEAIVIPVILRPSSWENTLFGKLQPLPRNRKPINDPSWKTRDKAYVEVAEGIRDAIQELSQKHPLTESPLPEYTANTASIIELSRQSNSRDIASKMSTIVTSESNEFSPSSSGTNRPTQSLDKKPELHGILKDYRERLAQMETAIDLGGYYTLTGHFAEKLNRLLVEIIATIRTTSIPLHETGNYFKSKDEMIGNIRQARIYLIMAMEVIHPADLSRRILRDMGPEKPVDFYQHLNTCREYLEDALKNW